MSLLQRSLDPEKTLGLVDVLYTAVLDLTRWILEFGFSWDNTLPTVYADIALSCHSFSPDVG